MPTIHATTVTHTFFIMHLVESTTVNSAKKGTGMHYSVFRVGHVKSAYRVLAQILCFGVLHRFNG